MDTKEQIVERECKEYALKEQMRQAAARKAEEKKQSATPAKPAKAPEPKK